MSLKASPVTTPQRWMIRPIMNPRCIHVFHIMHWQYATCHHLLFFEPRIHPMIEKQSQSQRHKVDDETHHVSSIAFILPFLCIGKTPVVFQKIGRSSHDIVIIVDDKAPFIWPCRKGPPKCCAFPVPFPEADWKCPVFQVPFPGYDWKCCVFRVPFPGCDGWKCRVYPVPFPRHD